MDMTNVAVQPHPPEALDNEQPLGALLYARISEERDRNKVAVEDQLRDMQVLCEREGWPVVAEFVDRDISAARDEHGKVKVRPGYDALLERMLTERRPIVVVCWRTDRLFREHVAQQAFLIAGREGALRLVASTTGERLDPTSADDEMIQDIKTAIAKHEVAIKRVRTKGRNMHKAERGEHSGGVRSWGYRYEHEDPVTDADGNQLYRVIRGVPTDEPWVRRWGHLVVVPEEAEEIRQATRRVIGGESLGVIVRDLNGRGVPTVTGKTTWVNTTLKDALIAPRVAGLRAHHERLYPSTQWEAIITPEDRDRMLAIFGARAVGPRPRKPRKHLLVSVLKCTKCGKGMYVKDVHGHLKYVCAMPSAGGCGSRSVSKASAEATAIEKLFAYLDSPKFAAAVRAHLAAEEDSGAQLQALLDQMAIRQRKLDELEEMFRTDPKFDLGSYRRMSDAVRADIEQTQAQIARIHFVAGPAMHLPGTGQTVAKGWEKAPLEEQRELFLAVFERNDVHPAKTRGGRWDPSRLEPIPRF